MFVFFYPVLTQDAVNTSVDFLGTLPFIDHERIGALGICGSGSFVISAAKIDPRIKAIATVSMYDMGAASRNGLKHSVTLEQRKAVLDELALSQRLASERADVTLPVTGRTFTFSPASGGGGCEPPTRFIVNG